MMPFGKHLRSYDFGKGDIVVTKRRPFGMGMDVVPIYRCVSCPHLVSWATAVQEGKESSHHRQSDSCKRSTKNVDYPALRSDGFADLRTHADILNVENWRLRQLQLPSLSRPPMMSIDKHRRDESRQARKNHKRES